MPALDKVLEPDVIFEDWQVRDAYFKFSKDLLRNKARFIPLYIYGLILWTRTAGVDSMLKFMNWYFGGESAMYKMCKYPDVKAWVTPDGIYERNVKLAGIIHPSEIVNTDLPFSYFSEYYLKKRTNKARLPGFKQAREERIDQWHECYKKLMDTIHKN